MIAQVRDAQAAYVNAARRMTALRPPAAGARVHRRLTAIYGATADKLARLLARRPFSPGRANTILANAHEKGDMRYGDVFTIPH